jgi:hypothetical protein
MQQQDDLRFAEIMGMLAEIYDDGKPVSILKAKVFYECLKEFRIDEIEDAVKRLIYNRTTASFPKPAEIIQEIRGTTSNRATMAWIEVLESIKHVGHYQSVRFQDQVIHGAISIMGGWVRLASEMTTDDEKWKQKEFERLYEILSKNPRSFPAYLPGLCEIQNAACGYEGKAEVIDIGGERLQLPTGLRAAQEG